MKDYWNSMSAGGKIKVIIYLIILIATVIFAIINWQKTSLNLVFVEVMIPKTILVLIAMVAGFGLAKMSDMKKIRTIQKDYSILQKSVVADKGKLVKEVPETND
ncbi:LapA family protein [Crocinitomix catalasitica]|uniref:hypothetical protein n=1 Tax=Crocinitomix catalasitica TaxID=184607 RepID=UPI00048728B6|nr:hypothetical protein [Crocinitomix catalasitica]